MPSQPTNSSSIASLTHPNPERTYLNIIDALHEAGRYPEALNWVQQARTRFKNDIGGALALFAQLRIHMAQQAWANVVRDADELSEVFGSRWNSRPRRHESGRSNFPARLCSRTTRTNRRSNRRLLIDSRWTQ